MSTGKGLEGSSRRSVRARNGISYKERDDKEDNDELRRSQGYSSKKQRTEVHQSRSEAAASSSNKKDRKTRDDVKSAEIDNVDASSLLDHVLSFEPQEAAQYEGWVELESDPALFNFILHKLGVDGVRCEEIFSMDELEIATLGKPIYGFVFLFECEDIPISDEIIPPPPNMWFATQTADNACATVALINVLMNANGVVLGDKLAKFKGETSEMILSHRGAYLSQDKLLRSTHNTFARRLDLMDADLGIMNSWEGLNKRQNKGKASRGKRKAHNPDSAKHYVAYIPHEGQIWELDGLDGGVICLGPYKGDWELAVMPHIRQQIEEFGLQANLLALCHSPLATIRRKLAENTACVALLQERLATSSNRDIMDKLGDWEMLADMGLSREDVLATAVPADFLLEIDGEDLTAKRAEDVVSKLMAERRDLRLEYDAARASQDQDLAAALRRCRDYTPMIHGWLRTMGEAGILDTLSGSQ